MKPSPIPLLLLLLASPILADEPKVQRGIPYAEPKNERQMLDVYAPTTGKDMPVVVWIHGGDGDTYDLPMRIATVHKKGDKKLAERDKQRFGDEAMQKDLSSITHVAKGKHIPPFLILHVADHPETRGQSQRLLQVLEAAGISAKAYPAEGKNHTTINNDLGLADDRPTQEMFAFLSAVLKK